MPIITEISTPKALGKESWLESQLKDVTNASVAKQMAIGGASGWCAGILFSKVGKTAASALAGSLLLFQVAQHQGYIKVNWTKVNKDLEKAKKQLDKNTHKQLPRLVEEVGSFIQDNKFLVTGFAGGFLFGIAMC